MLWAKGDMDQKMNAKYKQIIYKNNIRGPL